MKSNLRIDYVSSSHDTSYAIYQWFIIILVMLGVHNFFVMKMRQQRSCVLTMFCS